MWLTCIPKRYVGNERFFARDSGLLCKGFQEIGIKCKSIMPGPPMDVDQTEDLIRTDYQNLEDPEWWKSHGAEGVVLYAWGSGKYRKIACAIKQANLILVTHMDTAGILGVLNGYRAFSRSLLAVCRGESGNACISNARFLLRLAYASTIGLLKNDLSRATHLKQADIIGAITPIAMERIQKVCRIYGGEELAERIRLIPHPNSTLMTYDPRVPKEPVVVAIGRWNDERVKGTQLLMDTVVEVTSRSTDVVVEIYGSIPGKINIWHRSLPAEIRNRIKLIGIIRNDALAAVLQRASISLCTSLRESYHIASGEALCCGCSIVGPDVAEVPSMKYFTEDGNGKMAMREAGPMATAILEELQAWRAGERDPQVISRKWTARLHAPRVAEFIFQNCTSTNG